MKNDIIINMGLITPLKDKISENSHKKYFDIIKELDDKQKIIKKNDIQTLMKRKLLLKKNVEEVENIKKKYTYTEGNKDSYKFLLTNKNLATTDFNTNGNIQSIESNSLEKKSSFQIVFNEIEDNQDKTLIKNTYFNIPKRARNVNSYTKDNYLTLKEKPTEYETQTSPTVWNTKGKHHIYNNSPSYKLTNILSLNTLGNKLTQVNFHSKLLNNLKTRNQSINKTHKTTKSEHQKYHISPLVKNKKNSINRNAGNTHISDNEETEELSESSKSREIRFVKKSTKTDSNIRKKLNKIYKVDFGYTNRLKEAKLQKKHLDLDTYQNSLVQLVGPHFNKDSIKKLTDKMKEIRIMSNRIKLENISQYIIKIEKWEEDIIKNLVKKEEKLEILRETGKISNGSPLPKIKYKKIMN